MPPPDAVQTSRALAYICRHGAEKEGLAIRSDGYIRLADVLARPKMKGTTEEMVFGLVRDNQKRRFELVYAYDPSPPRPKQKPVQGQTKKQRAAAAAKQETETATIDTLPPSLPLITCPSDRRLEWYIRATQGHSIQLDAAHLQAVNDDDIGRRTVGLMVHGTKWQLWDVLEKEGLKRMSRQHIHLAPSLAGRITPRPSATLYIYLSLPKLAAAGIPVYVSLNGVVLTPGAQDGGGLGKQFWRKAVRREGEKRFVVWDGEAGGEAGGEREETEEERQEDERLDREIEY